MNAYLLSDRNDIYANADVEMVLREIGYDVSNLHDAARFVRDRRDRNIVCKILIRNCDVVVSVDEDCKSAFAREQIEIAKQFGKPILSYDKTSIPSTLPGIDFAMLGI